jgi:hypothetical protein
MNRNAKDKVRQHTVPQFYLRWFSVDGKRKQVVQYGKPDGVAHVVSIGDASVAKHCYSFKEDDGSWNKVAEDHFQDIENRAAPLWGGLQQHGGEGFSNQERYAVAEYIVTQLRRPRVYREHMRKELERGIADIDRLEALARERLSKLDPGYPEEKIQSYFARLRSGECQLPDAEGRPKAAAMQVLFDRLPNNASLVCELSWQVLKAPEDSFFVSSDVPAYVRRRDDDSDQGMVGIGRADLSAQLYFPLSVKAFLIAGHEPLRPMRDATKSEIDDLNLRTIRCADRWIYAHHKLDEIGDRVRSLGQTQTPLPNLS